MFPVLYLDCSNVVGHCRTCKIHFYQNIGRRRSRRSKFSGSKRISETEKAISLSALRQFRVWLLRRRKFEMISYRLKKCQSWERQRKSHSLWNKWCNKKSNWHHLIPNLKIKESQKFVGVFACLKKTAVLTVYRWHFWFNTAATFELSGLLGTCAACQIGQNLVLNY